MHVDPARARGGHVSLAEVSKNYERMKVLDGVTMHVDAGEFVTLLGPSGCGKTTLLRIIAGFTWPDEGAVAIDGDDITGMPPHRRPVNTVFQKPILLPHLNVAQNVAFGLRAKGVNRDDANRRVSEMLGVVRLAGFESRRSDELSGGQAQRVSLARALVNRPRMVLLDEPLSALDLQVRLDMQAELKRINRETGITFLYVTHDQQEAMAMSDRIAVLEAGRIRQLASPREIYDSPVSSFVARFVGNANVIRAHLVPEHTSRPRVRLDGSDIVVDLARVPDGATSGWLCARPEALTLMRTGPGLEGVVTDMSFLGSSLLWRVQVGEHQLRVHGTVAGQREIGIHDRVVVAYEPDRMSFLTS